LGADGLVGYKATATQLADLLRAGRFHW